MRDIILNKNKQMRDKLPQKKTFLGKNIWEKDDFGGGVKSSKI